MVINGSERFVIAKGYDYILTLDDLAQLILEAIDGYVLSLDSEDQNIYVEKQSESAFDIVNIEDMDNIGSEAPVYSLQGIELCTWQERHNLPVGVYIVNGIKMKL